MPLKPGTKAPDFILYDTDKKAVSLKDFTGKPLVIHFFPAAFTGVCTEQLCSSRDDLNFYSSLGVTVVGVSVDMPFSLKAFKEQQNINFPLLSDANKQMIHEYEMYHCNFACGIRGVAKRGVVVIGKDGSVVYSEETENIGKQVNFDALKQTLESIDQTV